MDEILSVFEKNNKPKGKTYRQLDKFDTSVIADESIILMQKGSEFIKLRNASKKYPRTYFLDPDLANLCWTPSKKGDRARSKFLLLE